MSDIKIMTQQTPNPFAMKFIVNRDVKSDGKVTYTDTEECPHVPLARELLNLPNVTQVHFFENVVTVTQNGASDWAFLEDTVEAIMLKYLPDHDPEFEASLGGAAPLKDTSHYTQEMKDIDGILEHTVRPYLQADGGDLELVSLEDNVLSIRYEGACGGCPSSMMGTLQAIQGVVQNEYDEKIVVVAI
jgi:Fe-S cluster biogenesis protein NfuA